MDSIAPNFTYFLFITLLRSARHRKTKLRRQGGLLIGKRKNKEIVRVDDAKRLNEEIFLGDYEFNNITGSYGPTFDKPDFERRYCITKEIYHRIRTSLLPMNRSSGKEMTAQERNQLLHIRR